ncbi:translation machinery-associated protein 16 [Scheffersomyces xylosifermentans]|uniref:translation machinery-associated protein 16 n=1 Tax=Scheffersomyces xylosifermentans TaxID=1304137 RepID=UPI00315DEDD8
MPLAHNLNKVTKNLSKSTGSIHIKGRKFKQLNRATLRDKKITSKKIKSLEQKENDLASIFFLQKLINEDDEFKTVQTFTLQEMKSFIELFISRFDDELEQLRKDRRPGRPQTNRQQILEEKRKYDQQIYLTGFKIPDLTDKGTVDRLKLWNGTTGGATVMKFVHVSKDMEQLPTKEVTME